MVQLLLQHGAKLEVENENRSPLVGAIVSGNVNVVRELVQNGADVNSTSIEGFSSIAIASSFGCVDVLQELPKHAPVLDNGMTPLFAASEGGNFDAVKLLLEQCTSVHVEGELRSPLHGASLHGQLDIVKLLLEHVADANCLDSDGWTALHMPAQNGHVGTIQELLQHDAPITMLSKGWTPLCVASENGHLGVVKILLAYGADHNIICKGDQTALCFAASKEFTDIVMELLRFGANANATNPVFGVTPIFLASMNGHGNITKERVQYGADINAKKYNGQTPLHVAIKHGHINVVNQILQSSNVNVNAASLV
ncbi:Aste57867_10828 [Aphanomyces stellatus]|uniref:Aste57867_10828 protein n=1 Tax=Aphanomyces stellatus TaxID=120398 RepID=A0A485KSI3_9STRA|nr:hypothetical protein As57867_010788 [Aphanomyces stellatus]VFT87696.1 Aste57867_10828 [Aphanomyces stellatus]